MADKTTTSFTKVGDSFAKSAVNQSGAPSKHTTPVQKKGAAGGALEAATAAHKSNIPERLGAKLHPSATLYKQNAAEANDTQRNVRTMPSAIGNRDFYNKRQYGQVQQ